MGAGRSQEAEWTLADDIRAGEWLLVADCYVLEPIDVRFEILWRKAAGGDVLIATWDKHFERNPDGQLNIAQAHELRGNGPAVGPIATGDQLIFRYTGLNGNFEMGWIPNGEGARYGGRVPHLVPP